MPEARAIGGRGCERDAAGRGLPPGGRRPPRTRPVRCGCRGGGHARTRRRWPRASGRGSHRRRGPPPLRRGRMGPSQGPAATAIGVGIRECEWEGVE